MELKGNQYRIKITTLDKDDKEVVVSEYIIVNWEEWTGLYNTTIVIPHKVQFEEKERGNGL